MFVYLFIVYFSMSMVWSKQSLKVKDPVKKLNFKPPVPWLQAQNLGIIL